MAKQSFFDPSTVEWMIFIVGVAVMAAAALWIALRSVAEFRRMRREPVQDASPPPESTVRDEPWHALETSRVMELLESSAGGLTADDARDRLSRFGANRLPVAKGRGPLLRFLAQFHNVLIYVLLAAGLVTAVLQHWLDAAVILGVVVVNALIGFVQEGKAEDALRAIREMLSQQALVLRDGKRTEVDAAELVPGDVVLLQAGDKVPADLRLIEVKGLRIEEAALTGESVPTEKGREPLPASTVLADRDCMAYSGTLVTGGHGVGVVVETGGRTEIGRISALVAEVEQLTTPLLRQMAQFGHWLTAAILVLAGAGFVFGVWVRDYTATEMFLASVGLAVAAIPEGLPAIMTITLAIGVQRMAARHAIIRRLPAVETLGTVAVICSDKTGTLTRNEMTVRAIELGGRRLAVSGAGYNPHGGFTEAEREHDPESDPALLRALRAAVLCNDASVGLGEGECSIQGDPMAAALLIAGIKGGLSPEEEAKQYPRTDLIPFDSDHRFMATLHHDHRGDRWVFVKGAPERLLEMCRRQRGEGGDEPIDPEYWRRSVEALAAMGYRVLAVAEKPMEPHRQALEFGDLDEGLVLLGLFGLIDPPRSEAITSVALCREAGIRVKMITGDHAITAGAIAAQVGLENSGEVLTGVEIDRLDDDALRARVDQVDVYARVSPEHKLRLVSALQARGRVTSMTGDGVNDAPALKRADVGVAMGASGTEAAKEAAEMVLTDDNFASIVRAVEEGRTVYDNLRKAILFILPTNGGEAMIMLGAILFGFHQFPLTPVQILWVNMITAVTLALALAFEPPEAVVMQRPPRDAREPVLSGHFLWRIAFVSLILMGGTFGLFLLDLARGATIEHARTVAVNTLVMFEIFYLFNSRYITAPVLNREGFLGNRYALAAVAILLLFQLGFTYLPPLQALFGTQAIGVAAWGRIVVVASSVLLLVELEKAYFRRRLMKRGSA